MYMMLKNRLLQLQKINRTALMNACKSGSKKVVGEMMKRGAFEVLDERQTRPKLTAAHEAAKSGALECLQVPLVPASRMCSLVKAP